MENQNIFNLLEKISSADLRAVGYKKLAAWMYELYYDTPNDQKLLKQENTCLKLIVQEIKKRDLSKINLDKWVEKDPKGLEDFLTLIPADLLKNLIFILDELKSKNKSLLKEIFERSNLRRMVNFNSGHHCL